MEFKELDTLLSAHFAGQRSPLVTPDNVIVQQPAAQANRVTLGDGEDPLTAKGLENIVIFPPSGRNPAKPCTMQDWLTAAIERGQTKEAIANEASRLLINGRVVFYQHGHARPTKVRLNGDNTGLIESEIGSADGIKPQKPKLGFIESILNFFGLLNGPDEVEHRRNMSNYNMEKYVYQMQEKRNDQINLLEGQEIELPQIQQQDNQVQNNQVQNNQVQNNQVNNNQVQNNQVNNNQAQNNQANNNQVQNNQVNNNQAQNNQANNNQANNNQNVANQAQPSGYEWKGKGTVVGQSTPKELAAKQRAADFRHDNQKTEAEVLKQKAEAIKLTEKLKKDAAARKEKIEFQNKNTKIQGLLELTEEEMRRPDNAYIRNPQLTEVLKLIAASIIMEAIEPLLDNNSPAYDDKFQALMLTTAFENFTNQGCQNISTSIKNGQFFDKFASHLMAAPTGTNFPMTSRNLNGLQTFCFEPPTMLKQLNAVLNKDLKIDDQPIKQIDPKVAAQQQRQAELDNAINNLKPFAPQRIRQAELNDAINNLKPIDPQYVAQRLREAELDNAIKNLKPIPAEKDAKKDPALANAEPKNELKNSFKLGI